jgi:6-pyruvoyltetrahydropterin/6-carboxytetrahydropterin synthase
MSPAYAPLTRVTHRYQFYASHRLHSPSLSEEANDTIYGKCNNPYGHGHNYLLEVSIEGLPDAQTGLLHNRGEIDEVVRAKVLKLFDHRNINKDVPEFETLVPTTENLALMIARILGDAFGRLFPVSGPRFVRVHIQETDRNGFDVLLGQPEVEPLMKDVGEKERVFA